MRSSREKLKLLRSLGSSCPHGSSRPLRNHPSLPPIHKGTSSSQTSRTPPPKHSATLRSNNHPQSHSYRHTTGHCPHNNTTTDENAPVSLIDLPKMDSNGLTPEVRAKAFNICRDYLHGAWKQIDSRDLNLKRVSGGLSNYLYHCSLPLTLAPSGSEPAEVLLRFYGQVHGEDALESLITESVIFTLLSERRLGPKLFGVFPGGRLEQFIPARPLLTEELRDPVLSPLIAQKMAQIHALNIPISKEASWLWGTMDRWLASVQESLSKTSPVPDSKDAHILLTIKNHNLEEELTWLRDFLPRWGSPVLFCHNDMQEGNILIRPNYNSLDEKLVLIDFEYCSYNYRAFDLANHFCEWSFNYQVENYPNFTYVEAHLPSHTEQLRFIRDYVATLKAEMGRSFGDREAYDSCALFDEDHILAEVKAFTLASHFFWTLWAIVNAQVSKIPFGYWEYALSRLETYLRLKKHFV